MQDTVVGYPNKRARTHRALVRGAMEVMAEHGPDGLTAAAVSRAAGVSTGTLYNHFEGIDALGLVVSEELATVLEVGAQQLPGLSGDPAARLALGLFRVLALVRADPSYAKALIAAIGQQPDFRARIRRLVAGEIARGAERGVFDVDVQTVATDAVLGATLQALRSMLLGEVGDERRAVVQAVLRMLGVDPASTDAIIERALAVHQVPAG